MTTDRQRHYGEGTVFQRSCDGLWIARLEIGRGTDGRRQRSQAILGHAPPLTTRGYQHVDLTMSRTALARLAEHLT